VIRIILCFYGLLLAVEILVHHVRSHFAPHLSVYTR